MTVTRGAVIGGGEIASSLTAIAATAVEVIAPRSGAFIFLMCWVLCIGIFVPVSVRCPVSVSFLGHRLTEINSKSFQKAPIYYLYNDSEQLSTRKSTQNRSKSADLLRV